MQRNRLLSLLAQNKAAGGRYDIKSQGREATVYVYDVIMADQMAADWLGGVAAPQFVKDIADLDVDVIHVRINSPGGDVFGARPMAQALREHQARVVAHIDGYAASAATLVAVAADEVRMTPGGFFMVHNSWMVTWGNADDLVAAAELLEKVDGTIVDDYHRKTGADREDIVDWMRAETWFTADEARDAGFVDHVDDDDQVENAAPSWDLSAYEKAPAASAGAISSMPVDRSPGVGAPELEQPAIAAADIEHQKRCLAVALL